ncbi:type II toxin-antitoxin system PemK/MazF family toxin [Lactobacillus sp.]|jgi:hypothetical protein|uniref:type II toxin-antitoxin system PemK/MazF family toxin n=1 Tax=Lactobacillus sp. TaxID=1591 RepID=UPI003EF80EB7
MSRNIATAYVRFVQIAGGKRRPIFIVSETDREITFYNITTKYVNKSDYIKKWYFEIKDYESTGLKKHSWIDTYNRYSLIKKSTRIDYIGKLSDEDTSRLRQFLARLPK